MLCIRTSIWKTFLGGRWGCSFFKDKPALVSQHLMTGNALHHPALVRLDPVKFGQLLALPHQELQVPFLCSDRGRGGSSGLLRQGEGRLGWEDMG